MDSEMLDVSMHERRLARRMSDPAFRAEYERTAREIARASSNCRSPGSGYGKIRRVPVSSASRVLSRAWVRARSASAARRDEKSTRAV